MIARTLIVTVGLLGVAVSAQAQALRDPVLVVAQDLRPAKPSGIPAPVRVPMRWVPDEAACPRGAGVVPAASDPRGAETAPAAPSAPAQPARSASADPGLPVAAPGRPPVAAPEQSPVAAPCAARIARAVSTDGAFEVVVREDRAAGALGTLVTVEGQWRKPAWVRTAVVELSFDGDRATVVGRDLVPVPAHLAILERFDPK